MFGLGLELGFRLGLPVVPSVPDASNVRGAGCGGLEVGVACVICTLLGLPGVFCFGDGVSCSISDMVYLCV